MTQYQINEMRAQAGVAPVNPATRIPEKSFAERYSLNTPSYDNSFLGALTGRGEPSAYDKTTETEFNDIASSIKEDVLPVGGAVVGGIGGGLAGATVGGPVGAYLGAVGGASAGGVLGETANQYLQEGKISDTGKIGETAKNMAIAEGVGGPLGTIGGKLISKTGEAIAKVAIPTSLREAGLIQAYKANVPLLQRIMSILGESKAPNTAAQTAVDKGLMGTESMIGVQAKKANKTLWNDLIAPQLDKSEVQVSMPAYFDAMGENIVKNNPELSRQKTLMKALEALREDYAGVKNVTLKELQKFKEGWAEHVPEKAYRGEDIAGAFTEIKNEAADMARDTIYKALGPEVKQAYFDYGNLKAIEELGKKAMTGGKLKGGAGSFISAIKDMLVTPVATIGGQTIYKVGQGVQLIGKPGARVLRDIIAEPSE